MLKLYNTLSRKIEEFRPIDPPKVGMYTCGPTVYDYQHIGNFRTTVLSDLLGRVLKYNNYEVKTVRNITDIDDKIIKNASEKQIPIQEYSTKFTKNFFEDSQKLNIVPPEVTTYATEYVPKIISYIEDLIKNGFAYKETDGSVYFSIAKFSDYGKLSGLDKRELKTGTRALSDEYSKENIQDFALWKAAKPGEIQSYDSPWGKGRPGWHIECSVMSQDNLGDSFDIHVGGVDLLFPHHENEIAQSEAKTGKPFVKYWVHGEHLMVDSQKMSKSLKNFYTLQDIINRGFDPLALRYFYLTAHYKTVLNFTWEAIGAAQAALSNLKFKIRNLKSGGKSYGQEFLEAINNDLNMPQALAVAWKTENRNDLMEFDKVFGLDLFNPSASLRVISPEIKRLLAEREKLRGEKKFAEADKIREELEKHGYTAQDKKL